MSRIRRVQKAWDVSVLANQVRSNLQFARVVKDAVPEMRRAVYERIRQSLPFRPMSFDALMFAYGNPSRTMQPSS